MMLIFLIYYSIFASLLVIAFASLLPSCTHDYKFLYEKPYEIKDDDYICEKGIKRIHECTKCKKLKITVIKAHE